MTDRSRDLDLHLLDRQIVDVEGEPVAKVDDVEFRLEDGELVLAALLIGPEALGRRVRGRLGRWIAAIGSRLRGGELPPPAVPASDIDTIGDPIRLRVHRDDLPFPRSEAWVREHVIGRLPGGARARE